MHRKPSPELPAALRILLVGIQNLLRRNCWLLKTSHSADADALDRSSPINSVSSAAPLLKQCNDAMDCLHNPLLTAQIEILVLLLVARLGTVTFKRLNFSY